MDRVGDMSGSREQNLSYLAEQMQRDYDLMSKAREAMPYPIIIMVALGIVGFLMFTLVLPKLTSTFVDLHVQLPIMTRVVIGMVDIFAHYGILLLLGMFLAIFGLLYWRKTDGGKQVIHKAVLYVPVFGPIGININLARFVRVFSSLIKSGMSIVEAVDASSNGFVNIYYQNAIRETSAKVRVATPLSPAFAHAQTCI